MKTTCDIIQDLMPLYCDNVCSEDSRQAVEVHIQECEQCKNDLLQMQKEIKEQVPKVDEKKVAKSAKTAWNKKKIIAFVAGCLAVVLIISTIIGVDVACHMSNSVDGGDYEALAKYTFKKHASLVTGEKLSVIKVAICVDHLAAIFQDEDGDWYTCVYDRDTMFRNRWIPSVFRYNFIGAAVFDYSFHRNPNGEYTKFIFGVDIPNEVCSYQFEVGDITYTRRVNDNIVLDMYIVTDDPDDDSDDLRGMPVALDENGEEVYRYNPF